MVDTIPTGKGNGPSSNELGCLHHSSANCNNNNCIDECIIVDDHNRSDSQTGEDSCSDPEHPATGTCDFASNNDLDETSKMSDDRSDAYKRFVCEHCFKTFSDPSNLQRHIRQSHAGARAHPCPECGKTFGTSSGLKQHQHIHSTVKPFTCEVCRKSYTQFSNLCRHKRMHATCRVRVKCANCGEMFSTSSSLNKHRRFCETKAIFASGSRSHVGRFDSHSQGGSSGEKVIFPGKSSSDSGSPRYQKPVKYNIDVETFDYVGANARKLAPFLLPFSPFSTNNDGSNERKRTLQDNMPRDFRTPVIVRQRSQINASDSQTQADDMQLEVPMKRSTGTKRHISDDHQSVKFRAVEQLDALQNSRIMPHSRNIQELISPIGLHRKHSPPTYDRSELKSFPNITSPASGPVLMNPVNITPRESNEQMSNAILSKVIGDITSRQQQHLLHLASSFAQVPRSVTNQSISNLPSSGPATRSDFEQPLDLSKGSVQEYEKDIKTSQGLPGQIGATFPVLNRTPLFGLNPYNIPWSTDRQLQLANMSQPAITNYWGITEVLAAQRQINSAKLYAQINDVIRSKEYERIMSQLLPFNSFMHYTRLPNETYAQADPTTAIYNMGRMPHKSGGSDAKVSIEQLQNLHMSYPHKTANGIIPRMNSQSNDRDKYLCKFCGKIFPRSANLTRHLRTHTGEQPYSCPYCERNFSISSNLQRHVRNIHKKERPYTCPLCNRAFGQHTNLERHLRKHKENCGSSSFESNGRDYTAKASKNECYGDVAKEAKANVFEARRSSSPHGRYVSSEEETFDNSTSTNESCLNECALIRPETACTKATPTTMACCS